jgi:hypothetical protein
MGGASFSRACSGARDRAAATTNLARSNHSLAFRIFRRAGRPRAINILTTYPPQPTGIRNAAPDRGHLMALK